MKNSANFQKAKDRADILLRILRGGGDIETAVAKTKRHIKNKTVRALIRGLLVNQGFDPGVEFES